MNVHAPSPPACTSTARPSSPINSNAIAHHCTGRCEKPKHAPTMAHAPTNPAMPMPAVKNSKMTSANPATNKKYATQGVPSVCASCCAEVELVEADLLVRLPPAVVALADHVGGVERDLLAVDRDRLPVERNDEVADRRLDRVDDVESLGVLGRQPTIDDSRDVLRAAVVGACASRTCVSTSRRDGSEVSSKFTGCTGPMPAPGATATIGAFSASNALAPRASAPEGPTHTPIGTVAFATRSTSASTSVSTAPVRRELDDEQRRVVGLGLVHDPREQRGVGRVEQAVDLHDRDAVQVGRGVVALRGRRLRQYEREAQQYETEQQADSCTGG